jgi:NAD(P)-dependent dehydrogenase (short-subunit alcohol dehydrogenase family)
MGVLEGSAVVVTGAGRGLGATYARVAAAEGASVVVNDVDAEVAELTAREIVERGGVAIAHPADVSEWSEAGTLLARCVDEFGRLDGLVNNAGIIEVAAPWEVDPQRMRRVLEVNLLGTMHCGLQAIPLLREQGFGTIVNSSSGTIGGFRLLSAYSASKGAITTLTFSWAMELEGTGVRVNAIAPNGATRLNQDFARYYGEPVAPDPPRPESAETDPLHNNGILVAYLLSDASGALNGQVIRMQGDELGIITHPTILDPTGRNERWRVSDVAAWFTDHHEQLRPLGLAHADERINTSAATLTERAPRPT